MFGCNGPGAGHSALPVSPEFEACDLSPPSSPSLPLESLVTPEAVLADARRMATGFFPEFPSCADALTLPLVQRAFAVGDTAFCIASANEWADARGWQGIPASAVDDDARAFRECGHDLSALASCRMAELSNTRLSAESVHSVISPQNPEFARLLLLADGMPVMVDPSFAPNGLTSWPKLSSIFLQTVRPVEALVHDCHSRGLGFYLRKSDVLRFVPDAHINRSSWALADKPEGRAITDCSAGSPALNCKSVKLASDELWGVIQHPTIDDVVVMILDFVAGLPKGSSLENLTIFKMDLKGAYTLISFRPSHVCRMGLHLSNDLAYFSLSGHYGWTGTPAAFQVITRAILWTLRHDSAFPGAVTMYVDDVIGICRKTNLPACLSMVGDLCRGLLGPKAVSDKKTMFGRCLPVLGYSVDLDRCLVGISERNTLRALYGFVSVNMSEPVPVKTMEKLASLASRYAKICRFFRPFTRFLYRSYTGRSHHASVPLDSSACLVIRLLRMLFLLGLTPLDAPLRLKRTFESFRQSAPLHLVEFDASLFGIGLLFFDVDPKGLEVPVAVAQVDISSLGFGVDSSWQNTAEFIAAIFCLRGAHHLGWSNTSVLLRGDSVSALTWAKKEGVRSDRASSAGVVFVYQAMLCGDLDLSVVHLEGKKNVLADALSRQRSSSSLVPAFASLPTLSLQAVEILPLCNPALDLETDHAFWDFIAQVKSALSISS